MKKGVKLNAILLRRILIVSLVFISLFGIGIFSYSYSILSKFADETSQTASQAVASDDSLSDIAKMETSLKEEKDAVERASKIVAQSKSYQYQDQIISDLNGFANKAGVKITGISFNDGSAASSSNAASSTSTPTNSSATSAPSTGLKSTTASVTIENPVEYRSILNFIYLIEQSLTKMHISSVSLSHSSDGQEGTSRTSVTSDALTIEVYLQ